MTLSKVDIADNPSNPRRRLEDQIGVENVIIPEGVEIKGSVNGPESMLIAGNLEGQVSSSGLIWILKGAKIEGDIKAGGVIIEGYVHGNIHSTGKVELRSTALIKGEITCSSLAVSKGCSIEGRVDMPEGRYQAFTVKRKKP